MNTRIEFTEKEIDGFIRYVKELTEDAKIDMPPRGIMLQYINILGNTYAHCSGGRVMLPQLAREAKVSPIPLLFTRQMGDLLAYAAVTICPAEFPRLFTHLEEISKIFSYDPYSEGLGDVKRLMASLGSEILTNCKTKKSSCPWDFDWDEATHMLLKIEIQNEQ